MPAGRPLPILSYYPPYVHKPSFFRLDPLPDIPHVLDIPEDMVVLSTSMISFLLEWMRIRGIITYKEMGKDNFIIIPTREGTKGGAVVDIIDRNMRTLAYRAELNRFLESIRDNDVRTIMTDIQSLAVTLTTLYPDTLINIIINKVYRSLDSLPIEDADYTWDEIHATYPFLWVVMYMQTLLYRFSEMH